MTARMQFARRARLGDTQTVVSSLINDLRQPFHQRQYESSQIRATVRTSGRRHLGNVRERYPEWVGTKTWEERSTPQWARTTNLRFRRPMLYPIELGVQRVVCGISSFLPALGSTRRNKEYPALPANRQGVTACRLPTRQFAHRPEIAA